MPHKEGHRPESPGVIAVGGGNSGGKKGGGKKKGGGGGSSGGGGGGGGGRKAKPKKLNLGRYKRMLRDQGLSPANYGKWVKKAAKGNWGEGEFMGVISRTKRFRKEHPGIGKLLQTMSAATALATWREYRDTVNDGLAQLGIGTTLGADEIGFAITKGIKADELLQRYQLFDPWRKSQGAKDWFNGVLSQLGRSQLDDEGWRKFILEGNKGELADIYETARLSEMGVEAIQGLQIAKALGMSGEPADLTALPNALQTLKMEAGQELQAAGLTDQDLVTVALREQLSGELRSAADQAAEKVNQILANRAARKTGRQQSQPGQSVSGRPLLPSAPGAGLESIG